MLLVATPVVGVASLSQTRVSEDDVASGNTWNEYFQVIATDSTSGVINEADASITLTVLSDFRRIAITFGRDVDTIEAKQPEIVT